MDISKHIKSMPNEMKMTLINFVTDLPSDTAMFVKRNINTIDFDRGLFKGNDRYLHPYSVYNKLLQNVNIIPVKHPIESCYQSRYCSILVQIDTEVSSGGYELVKAMNTPCYTASKLMEMESNARSFLLKLTGRHNRETVGFVTSKPDVVANYAKALYGTIIPYKLAALEFNENLEISINSNFMYTESCSVKSNLYGMIMRYAWEEHPNREYILAHLLYVFVNKMMGGLIDDDMLLAMDGFMIYFKYVVNPSKQTSAPIDIDEISTEIERLRLKTTSISDAAKDIDEYIVITDDQSVPTKTTSIQFDNHIFMIKGADIDELMNSQITGNIDIFDEKWISKSLANNDIPSDSNNITFELTPNDLGHVINITQSKIGTVVHTFTHKMKYITKYNDDWYVLFKKYDDSGRIYGVALTGDDDKILVITKDKKYSYKYIPNF